MNPDEACRDPDAFAGCLVVGAPGTANIDLHLLPFLVVGCWLLHCPENTNDEDRREDDN